LGFTEKTVRDQRRPAEVTGVRTQCAGRDFRPPGQFNNDGRDARQALRASVNVPQPGGTRSKIHANQ
jgi:hypothetical protein